MNFEYWQITIIIAIFFAFLEIVTPSFFFLGVACGCLPTAFIQWSTGGPDFSRDIVIFAISSIVSFSGFRFFFKKPKDIVGIDDREDINRY